MEIETCVLTPLDTAAKQRAFEAFLPLYVAAFPVLDEREDPALWQDRILRYASGDQTVPTITTVIVAGHDLLDTDRLTVIGGIVIEVFLKSQTGLVSYVAVAPDAQGQGVARLLVEAAYEAFLAAAAAEQERRGRPFEIRAVFAEAEDPRLYDDPDEKAVTQRRLQVLGRLGARWIDVPYLQPALGEDRSAIDLLLLAIPLPGQPADRIGTEVVWAFLAEHYGIPDAGERPPAGSVPPEIEQRWEQIKVRLAELMLEAEAGAGGGQREVSEADIARARQRGVAALRPLSALQAPHPRRI